MYSVPFLFKDIASDEEAKKLMKRRNRGATELPQIFVDDEFIGVRDL
jgi:glutaredoxin